MGDEPYLSNILQLTSPTTGFTKAGEAYFSPDGQKISFQGVAVGDDEYSIYIMDLNSYKIKKVSPGKGASTCSYFSPDGKKLIFASSPKASEKSTPQRYKWDFTPFMNIYEYDIEKENLTQLTFGPFYNAECAYSPDGESIVFASNRDGHMNIYIMDKDGQYIRQITKTKGCYNGGPFFSPDGGKIVFRADRDKPHYLQIYTIDVRGENLLQITNNQAVNWAPFWHPTQKSILYTSSLQGHNNYQLFLLNLETHENLQITDKPPFNGLGTFNLEGTKMLFTSKRGPDNTSQVFIADFLLSGDDL